jgi:hypothetical protein
VIRVGVVVATLLTIVDVEPADACSPPPDSIVGRSVVPEDGATGVPTNARVLIQYESGLGPPTSALELRALGGACVAFTEQTTNAHGAAMRILVPTGDLAPATTYEVLDTLDPQTCPSGHPDCYGPPMVIASFTTGDSADLIAPSATGVTVESWYNDHSGSTCEKHDNSIVYWVTIDALADDRPTSWLRLEYRDPEGNLIGGPLPIVRLGSSCPGGGGSGNIDVSLYTSSDDFFVRVVDLAGNAEAESHFLDGLTCAEGAAGGESPDGGTDGGSSVDGGDDGGGGCSTQQPTGVVLVLVMIALARRRQQARVAR